MKKVKQIVKQKGFNRIDRESNTRKLALKNGASGRSRTDGQRFTNLPLDVLNCCFAFKLELSCQLPETRFVQKMPDGVTAFHSIR
ncbi:hypothetical protein ACFLTJ_00435 [Chloroflexota bacterium]